MSVSIARRDSKVSMIISCTTMMLSTGMTQLMTYLKTKKQTINDSLKEFFGSMKMPSLLPKTHSMNYKQLKKVV